MATLERFENRAQAGALLAQRLQGYAQRSDVIVLALPRGGVPVGFAVAQALQAPLDVLLVRKLGVPGQEEYAMGAIARGGLQVLQTDVIDALHIPPSEVFHVAQRELQVIEQREALYRAGYPALPVKDRVAILVDDGLATGSTMRVAVHLVRQLQPARVVVAAPVAAVQTCRALGAEVDEIVCLHTPEPFYGVGLWYQDFAQTSDAQVMRLLQQARQAHQQAPAGWAP